MNQHTWRNQWTNKNGGQLNQQQYYNDGIYIYIMI